MYIYIYASVYMYTYIKPIIFGVSRNLNLQFQSHWSLFNGTWQGDLENEIKD